MKKLLLFGLVFIFGICIGVFLALIWKDGTNSNTDNKTEVSETAPTIIRQTNNEITKKNTVANEKLAEEMHDLFSNSYYNSQWIEFQKHGKQINENTFKVFYVASGGQAYVLGKDEFGSYNGQVYYLIDEEDSDLYEDQIIKVPKGKVVKRYGTIDYRVKSGVYKRVPKIMIMDAN